VSGPRGMIFDIKRFAIHDGPGIRTTVFLKGCPLRCASCHNPEGRASGPEIILRGALCIRCGACTRACPRGALSAGVGPPRLDRSRCDACGACAEVCVADGIERVGREATVAEVLAEVERDIVVYDESGGGVTFSGGEPLAQPAFLEALLLACRARGIRTAVDTCGYAPRETIARACDLADLILYDIKMMDGEGHRALTGVPNREILENLRWLAARGRPVVVRVPLVPGVNDGDGEVRLLGEFVASLPGRPPIDILPYHRSGAAKYERLGRVYALPDASPPAAARVSEMARLLADFGLDVTIRGNPHGRQ